MKTPQQLSDEVLQKISARKAKEKRIYRNTLRIGALFLIIAVIIPLSLMMNDKFSVKNEMTGGNANMENAGNDAPSKPENSAATSNSAFTPSSDTEEKNPIGSNGEATDNDCAMENEPTPENSENNEEDLESSEEENDSEEA